MELESNRTVAIELHKMSKDELALKYGGAHSTAAIKRQEAAKERGIKEVEDPSNLGLQQCYNSVFLAPNVSVPIAISSKNRSIRAL
ncbi:unnamed protein product [Nezara viridula]|uniref:Uncharacterized protein n=1 Tax=Nezara viridula TaxID=85310 RepID=A0A9P0MUE8_NEZVI|nr:unnamed protein product [Nezara viridula]